MRFAVPGQQPPIPILRTKLHRRPVTGDCVWRVRLHQRMDRGLQVPLTLVSAPAGYGKTTLVRQWIGKQEAPYAWLSLDQADSDIGTFLSHLLAAIRAAFAEAGSETVAFLQASDPPPIMVLARSLANDLDTIGSPFVLILDDYHRLGRSLVHELLSDLLEHPPRFLHLVIATRHDPPLPLAALRASGHMTEVGLQDLQFTALETKTFLKKAADVSVGDAALDNLQKEVEGWAVGLRLVSLSLRQAKDPDGFLSGLRGDVHDVREYMLQEVVASRSPTEQEWLLKTSLFDRFCPQLCDALCHPKSESGTPGYDGYAFLEALQKSNLFCVPLDGYGEWFRYHHLFGLFLRTQLEQRIAPEDIAVLHSRASAWFAEHNLIDEAIQHALAAGDDLAAAHLVECNRHRVLDEERWHVLAKWLAQLPSELRQTRPELLMARAWVLFHQCKLSALPPVLDTVESMIDKNQRHSLLGAELDFFRGFFSYLQVEDTRSREFYASALEKIPESHTHISGEAALNHALATHKAGHKKMAVRGLIHTLSTNDSLTDVHRTRLWSGLSLIHLLECELTEALPASQQVRDIARKNNLACAEGWGWYEAGCVFFLRNEPGRAIQMLERNLTNRYALHRRMAVDTLAIMALSFQALGNSEKTNETMQDLRNVAFEASEPEYINIANSCQARLSIMEGNREEALRWLQAADLTTDCGVMLWWAEIPRITECRALIAEGSAASLQEAVEKLQRYEQENSAVHNSLRRMELLALKARAYHKQKKTKQALTAVDEAVNLGRRGGVIRPFVEAGPLMAELLRRLLKQNGEGDFPRELLAALGREASRRSASGKHLVEPLTNREEETLEFLAQRLRGKEIAQELGVCPETVKSHLKHIYEKLGVSGRRQAVEKAHELGLLIAPGPSSLPN